MIDLHNLHIEKKVHITSNPLNKNRNKNLVSSITDDVNVKLPEDFEDTIINSLVEIFQKLILLSN